MPDLVVEEVQSGGNLAEIASRNAVAKFMAAAAQKSDWLLTADTLVGLDAQVLGKPRNPQEAVRMLSSLSDKTHQVVTAYCLGRGERRRPELVRWVRSDVTFRPLNTAEIETYVGSGEPFDKAGAYGIQGSGGHFIAHVKGSVSNVMGLPMLETAVDCVRLSLAVFACPN